MSFYRNKRVLVTGHTGFKGSWLSIWLNHLGAEVYGISDREITSPSNYKASEVKGFIKDYKINLLDSNKLTDTVLSIKPDIVFHLAAQALVIESYKNPQYTFSVNAIGTINLLEALKRLDRNVISIFVTSDKAYDNLEWVWGYRETDKLGGKDPYSASKGMAELAIRSYFESFFKKDYNHVKIGITRAGNVIGGGDWANDRIVPDAIKAWSRNKIVRIRNPKSTRPWQHVLEPLFGYLTLAKELHLNAELNGEPYNFGPSDNNNYSVDQLLNQMTLIWTDGQWEDISKNSSNLYEANLLKLNCDKALTDLEWSAVLNFKETVDMTVSWYKKYYETKGESMYNFSVNQIEDYVLKAQKSDIKLNFLL